jgi:hypothetical protein
MGARRWWRVGAVVAVAAMGPVLGFAPGVSAAGHRIGPNQLFIGLINGHDGQGQPATVAVACPGPVVGPNQTGHPVAGQTITVSPAPSTAVAGDTGPNGRAVTAWFGAPPPTPVANPADGVTFTRYGTMSLPTSLIVPCAGTHPVIFLSAPLAGARAYVVQVTYENVAA